MGPVVTFICYVILPHNVYVDTWVEFHLACNIHTEKNLGIRDSCRCCLYSTGDILWRGANVRWNFRFSMVALQLAIQACPTNYPTKCLFSHIKQENIQQSQMPSEKRLSEKRGLHCRTRSTQMPLSLHTFSNIENKAWKCPFHAPEVKPKVHTLRRRHEPLYKRFSFDDAWMERNRRRKLVKETQSDRETDSSYLLKDQLKVRT